jgi:chitinase
MLKQLKQRAHQQGAPIRTFFSVGGWGPYSTPFAALARDPVARHHFVEQAIALCDTYDFDGIDIDWEYPNNSEEAHSFLLLLQDLHAAFKAHSPELFVTLAAPAGYHNYERIDWAAVAQVIDTVHLMTYDFHGAWDAETNHQAPLRATTIGDPRYNTSAVVENYLQWIPREKLTVGLPLYYRTYNQATGGTPGSHYGSSHSGAGNPAMPSYHQVMQELRSGQAISYRDDQSAAVSVYYPGQRVFATGVDERAILEICDYIGDQQVAGAMIWELSGDTSDWQALRLINGQS